MQRYATWAAVALIVSLFGCSHSHVGPNPLPAVGSSIDKAQAHVDSAETAVQRAKPESNKTGQALLDIASGEHHNADKELAQAKKELADAQKDRDRLLKDNEAQAARIKKDESGWGYRLQQFVTAVRRIIIAAFVLHFLLGVAALFAGPYAGLLKLIGGILNPFAWFQYLVDHIHLRRCDNTPCPPAPPCPELPKLAAA